jgi:NADH-quinone oxidoreductase subunit K
MIALSDYLILSSIVFCIGLAGIFINRTNIIMILMCVELIWRQLIQTLLPFLFMAQICLDKYLYSLF